MFRFTLAIKASSFFYFSLVSRDQCLVNSNKKLFCVKRHLQYTYLRNETFFGVYIAFVSTTNNNRENLWIFILILDVWTICPWNFGFLYWEIYSITRHHLIIVYDFYENRILTISLSVIRWNWNYLDLSKIEQTLFCLYYSYAWIAFANKIR